MVTGRGEYGQMPEWVERQQRRIAELEAENRELRRQLDELRRGAGIAVVIQGRSYPLAAPAPSLTGEHPAVATGPRYPQAHGPAQPADAYPRARPAGAPRRGYDTPLPAGHHATAEAPAFAEDAWLTGSMRAIPARARLTQPQRPAPAPRAQSPSQSITPQWLRDDQAHASGPREPATWDEIAAAQDSWAPGPATGAHTYVRPRVKSRPLTPRLEPVPFGSLAQLTGQQPAVRKPANRERTAPRTPLSDSFLLG